AVALRLSWRPMLKPLPVHAADRKELCCQKYQRKGALLKKRRSVGQTRQIPELVLLVVFRSVLPVPFGPAHTGPRLLRSLFPLLRADRRCPLLFFLPIQP